jgi:hypothetical protein
MTGDCNLARRLAAEGCNVEEIRLFLCTRPAHTRRLLRGWSPEKSGRRCHRQRPDAAINRLVATVRA